jgi:hypothetical protein
MGFVYSEITCAEGATIFGGTMKVYLNNYKPKEPFTTEDCKTCKSNIGEDVITCTNPKAVDSIFHNVRCEGYEMKLVGRKVEGICIYDERTEDERKDN